METDPKVEAREAQLKRDKEQLQALNQKRAARESLLNVKVSVAKLLDRAFEAGVAPVDVKILEDGNLHIEMARWQQENLIK